MSLARFQRRADQGDHWPGYVDALATLLLVVIFLLSLFTVAQFVLGRALSSKDKQLAQLELQLADLANQLGLEKKRAEALDVELKGLRATLAELEAQRSALLGERDAARAALAAAEARAEEEAELSKQAQIRIAELQAALDQLNAQLASLRETLEAAEAKDKEQKAEIKNLSERLNAALAQKVQELAKFRSQFFEALLKALGDRADVRVVGDRFVFETDVLFSSGSAELSPDGAVQLIVIADAIRDIADKIPQDIDWVIRIDGHTDVVPIATERYPSNWQLSAARAISVVNFFENQGVRSKRLVAAGFGEYHPIDPGRSAAAYAKNRRIELKLDAR